MARVLHIISNLDAGGAETMLLRLLENMNKQKFAPSVVSLTNIGAVGERILALGVPVYGLGMRRGRVPNPLSVLTLARLMRREWPGVVHTWMYHADLLGALASKLAGSPPVLWSIHHTTLEPGVARRGTIWTARACARLSSRIPRRIVYCSDVSRRLHEEMGYASDRTVVIPNGFDLGVFRPSPADRASVREERGLAPDTPLVGLVARFHPDKDHSNFAEAAGLLAEQRPRVRFLLCGEGVTEANERLAGWIARTGHEDRFHLLGRRDDVPRVLAALDVLVSSSSNEAFPLALGEAMACGVPCVTTDVGDSARIVGETGRVVPPGDPQALAAAMGEILDMSPDARRALGASARERIEARYSLGKITERYQDLYAGLAR